MIHTHTLTQSLILVTHKHIHTATHTHSHKHTHSHIYTPSHMHAGKQVHCGCKTSCSRTAVTHSGAAAIGSDRQEPRADSPGHWCGPAYTCSSGCVIHTWAASASFQAQAAAGTKFCVLWTVLRGSPCACVHGLCGMLCAILSAGPAC